METKNKTIIIYIKEIMLITGKTESAARRLADRIRKEFKKPKKTLITIEEFCKYTGLGEGSVRKVIRS
ncbi:MAG: hypothetical protein ABI402_15605 [Ferruginibacter sp.]